MLLKAALNGDLAKVAHPAVPISVDELARDARPAWPQGLGQSISIRATPRVASGWTRRSWRRSSLASGTRAAYPSASRPAPGSPDLGRRLELVQAWRGPDYASVNVSEPGSTEVMTALIQAGVGIEAGVWTVEDAERLAASGLGEQITRILVEPVDAGANALEAVDDIHRALDSCGLTAPRLQHGDGEATWVLLTDAVRRGLDTRIGLEDTLYEPHPETSS